MSVPNRVAELRTAREWTQAQLAEQCGVPRSSISAIEIGRLVPAVDTALRVASAFGVTVEAVFGTAAGGPEGPTLAWDPPSTSAQVWQARVGRLDWLYPVESTAAGTLAPDGMVHDGAFVPNPDQSVADRTLVVAGCDPSVALLMRVVGDAHGIRVLPLQRSSSDALDLLKRGAVHVAGVHLSDPRGRATNAAAVRDRLGPGYRLLHQMRWQEGVAVASTRRSPSIAALLRNGTWVNREPGSAARACLDRLLHALPHPTGYQHTVRSHQAVAATVSSGWAEAGVCIRQVAEEAGLNFLSVHDAAYELCIPETLMDDMRIRALVDSVRSPHYRQWINGLPGCSAAASGDLVSIGTA